MLRSTYIRDVPAEPGKEVTVGGWVSRLKDLKSTKFVWVTDKTGTIQVTLAKDKVSQENFSFFDSLNLHDFILVTGIIPEKILAKNFKEIIPKKMKIVGKAEKPLPIDVNNIFKSELETRLDWRSIALREPKLMLALKVQSSLVEGMVNYLNKHDFTMVFTPSIMGVASEGGSEVFPIVYYDKTTYLRQDPQLHRQLLMVAGLDKIYEVGPSWRAELSHTPRHLSEHRTCAAEISFIEDEHDVMHVEEELVQAGVKNVIEKHKNELDDIGISITVPKVPFPELDFPNIYDIISELGKSPPKGKDIEHESEILLAKYVKEKFNSDFFFINRFPYKVKPFYVMRYDDDPEYARSVDLEYKGMELSSGGQREHRYNKIIEQAKEKGVSLESIAWFAKFFKYGAPPHGGFSIGLERIVMQLLNMPNILEVPAFPRTSERVVP
ncbi:MAG: aspartate--tRNA(Asn) ligase [Candidatus Micrarchaeaceae archaeon]